MPQLATSFRHPVGDGSVTRARDGDGYYTSQGHGSYYAGYGYHLGEDWNGDGGGNTDLRDPVYAAANGRIVFAGNGGTGWGNVVIIQHTMPDGSTVSTLYGHLDRINVSAGDVTIGQQIGTIGTGGGLYAAHLHFEVYLGSMSRPGTGYTSSPDPDPFNSGYVNPTRFIDSHRTIVTDIPGSSATTAVLTLGELQRSSIETVRDSDWFRVYLVAGQSYSFAVRGSESNNGTLNDPKIRLRGPDETILITRDNGGGDRDARITGFTATESGYYYVTAYSADGGTGSYTIRAIQSTTTSDIAGSTATTSTLAPGGSASSTIATSGDQDWFRISLTAGQTYTFAQNAASGSDLDCYLRLLNSSGTQLTYSDDDGPGNNSLITFTATSSGTYYLSAQGYNTSTGGYTISVSSGGATDTTAPRLSSSSPSDNAPAVAVGANLVLNFNEAVRAGSGTIDIYTSSGTLWRSISVTDSSQVTFSGSTVTINPSVDLAAGTSYYVRMGSGVIRDTAGNGFAGFSYNTDLNFTTATSGTTDIPDTSATTAVLTVGGSQSSSVDRSGDSDWFRVYLVAGQTYSFAVRGNESGNGNLNDPMIRLRSPNETILITDDNGGGVRDARITGFTATQTGYHFISAYSADSGTGSYTVSAIQSTTTTDIAGSTATTSTLSPGGSTSSTIATSGDQDWFRISLTAGQTYTFAQNAASGSDLDCYLRLLNSSGTQLTYSDDDGPGNNSLITFTATSSGTYYLSAQGYNTSTGGYTISVSSGSAARATSASVGLSEASSADLLSGGAASPALWGGRGGDLLRGDFGDAGLGEGGGSDVFAFLFGFGSDRTIGSDDPEGSLHLFPARSAGGMTAPQIAESIAAAHSGANAFELGDGHRIALNGVGTLAALADDLVFA